MIAQGQQQPIKCFLSIDDGPFDLEVSASITGTDGRYFKCTFTGSNLPVNSTVSLKLTNVANPATTTDYLQYFQISTGDGSNYFDK